MPLDPKQRHRLLMADKTGDVGWITATINQMLADNPETNLLEIEMVFRAGASSAFVIATTEGFEVIVGMKAWVTALDAFGRTPEVNRQLLAAIRLHRKQ
jgi:hypothetical protein